MAKDILYMQDGGDVNASWCEFIAISSDGVNWDLISKAGLQVGKHALSLNSNAPNSYPEASKSNGFVVTLKRGDDADTILKFNPENVTDQATWRAGTPSANGIKAMLDIGTWISA